MRCCFILFLLLVLSSCKNSQRDNLLSILEEWEKKEIQFPYHSVFTIQGKDTVEYGLQNKYKILLYTDSLGCMSCKLYLTEWTKFAQTVDSLYPNAIQFLFFFSPDKKRKINRVLLENRFNYPICIDEEDSINILNHFPSNVNFQTFLLNQNNKVIAIGNPVHNIKIRELYFKVISGDNFRPTSNEKVQTDIILEPKSVDMGTFGWEQKQVVSFVLLNTGKNYLAINDVTTSCGCTTVEYSKEPTRPGGKLSLKIKYKADYPEYFSKTVTVYCNAKGSPFQLKISGNAE